MSKFEGYWLKKRSQKKGSSLSLKTLIGSKVSVTNLQIRRKKIGSFSSLKTILTSKVRVTNL